jgi:uncharacterized protein
MRAHFAEGARPYTGAELRSLWIYRTFGIEGDATVAFIGPCDVAGERLVDQVDAQAGSSIAAASMLHLVVEHFGPDLRLAVHRQRLLVCLAREALGDTVASLRRDGDDLYVGQRKLSVSIATVSPVSSLIHLGLNVDPAGAPVPACGLGELGVDPRGFAERLMAAYGAEIESVERARCTVRGVP